MAGDARARERELVAEILERARQVGRLRQEEAPFVPGETRIPYAGRVYDERELAAVVEASLDFWLTAGRWHDRLERSLAEWYGVPCCCLVNSGSSANLLAVAALMSPDLSERRLRRGDEVITVAAGFPTTVAPLVQLGLVPVFVDVGLPTANIDVAKLEAALSPKTRAIILAHTLGNPFDLDRVLEVCERAGLWLIEDNCDAAGARFRGRKTGTFGDLATLSFYPPHHMTTGEGGAVLARDAALRRTLDSLRDWGRDCWCTPGVDDTCGRRFGWRHGDLPAGYDHKYVYRQLGYNLKMTDLQAAVGVPQLEKLDGFVEARRANWRFLRDALADLEDVFILPDATPGSDPSWFGFLLVVRPDAPFTRAAVVRFLERRRVQTRMLFAGNLVRQPALTRLRELASREGTPPLFRVSGALETTDIIMERAFWVGVYPGLTAAKRAYLAESIRAAARDPKGLPE